MAVYFKNECKPWLAESMYFLYLLRVFSRWKLRVSACNKFQCKKLKIRSFCHIIYGKHLWQYIKGQNVDMNSFVLFLKVMINQENYRKSGYAIEPEEEQFRYWAYGDGVFCWFWYCFELFLSTSSVGSHLIFGSIFSLCVNDLMILI